MKPNTDLCKKCAVKTDDIFSDNIKCAVKVFVQDKDFEIPGFCPYLLEQMLTVQNWGPCSLECSQDKDDDG